MDTISTQSGSTAALVEAVLLVRCGSKYAFIGSHDQPSQLRPPSLQLADLEAVHSLESSLRRCVSALTSTEVEAIGLLSVEVGITSPTEALARGFGMRLVTEATVSESLQPATLKPIASPTAKEVRWLDRRDIEATLESEPSLLFQGTNVLKWATMCEENPTRLNLSSFVGLRQGFSPFSPPPPVETTDGIPVASGRAAPTLESREEEVLQKSHLGPVELTQIASEFSACCGSGAKKMNRQAFPAFISKLGISSTAASDLYTDYCCLGQNACSHCLACHS